MHYDDHCRATVLAQVGSPWKAKRESLTTVVRITHRLSSNSNRNFWCISPDHFPSDVESLRKGIIKTSKNKVQAPYTILLVGETGVGKSSLLEFITNVLIGNNIDCYDFTIPDNGNKQNGSSDQNQTGSACCYEITSNNGIVVSGCIYERDEQALPLHRFASSIYPG